MKKTDTIITIVQVEFKLLGRNWTFRFLSLCTIIGCIWYCLSMFGNFHRSSWNLVALPASLPFTCCYLLNFTQVFLLFFIAGNFWKSDKKKDSSAAFLIRPFDDRLYILGKLLGVVLCIALLNGIVLLIASLVHIFASYSPFNFFYYFFYFVTLLLPSLIFYSGLIVIVKRVIKNEGLAIFTLFLVASLFITFTTNEFHATDIFALEIPNLFSEITFLKDSPFYLQQRLYVLLFGSGLWIFALQLPWRKPNRNKENRTGIHVGISFLLLAFIPLIMHHIKTNADLHTREIYKNNYLEYENRATAHITRHNITFQQKNESINLESNFTIKNPHEETLPHLVLYLNPGLKITHLSVNHQTHDFIRKEQIVRIEQPLAPNDSLQIEITCEGYIDERICYPEVSPDRYRDRKVFRSNLHYRFERHYAYAGNDYTLLTPECLWYPVAIAPVNVTNPLAWERQFTRYSLIIKDEKLNRTISLGEGRQQDNDVVFSSTHAYAGLSFSIGQYEFQSLRHGECIYKLLHYKGHDRLSHFFNKQEVIKKLDDLQQNHNKDYFESWGGYPDRITLVETPLSSFCFAREGRTSSEFTQSEILFVAERGVDFPFYPDPPGTKPGYSSDPLKEIVDNCLLLPSTWDISGNLILGSLTSKSSKNIPNKRNLLATLIEDITFIADKKYPGLNYLFLNLKKPNDLYAPYSSLKWEYDTNLLYHTLVDILQMPGQDKQSLSLIINDKTTELKDRLFSSASRIEIKQFISDYFHKRRYQQIYLNQFSEMFQERFNLNFTQLLDDIYNHRSLPLYRIKDVNFYRITGEKESYAFTFKAWNQSTRDGILKIHYTLTKGNSPHIEYLLIKPGECKEFRIVWPYRVSNAILNTGLSRNIPNIYMPQNIHKYMPPPETGTITPGIFDIDNSAFDTISPDEFIVDNRDTNFYWKEGSTKLISLFKKDDESWKFPIHSDFYGDSIRDAALHKANNKGAFAEWQITLPREGKYEVFVYNPSILQSLNSKHRKGSIIEYVSAFSLPEYTQTYTLYHAKGQETISIDLKQAEQGWVSLGTYEFAKDHYKLILHDHLNNPNFYIIADAVKWKKQ